MLTMNSVKILHAVRSAITATAELLVLSKDDSNSPVILLALDLCRESSKIVSMSIALKF